ncbi:unnamed protein product [Amoebophrya sp. A120]|nr:unnamed protein product [Amoebophrya sp. A120]|eukprot:GSA120T00022337001.1
MLGQQRTLVSLVGNGPCTPGAVCSHSVAARPRPTALVRCLSQIFFPLARTRSGGTCRTTTKCRHFSITPVRAERRNSKPADEEQRATAPAESVERIMNFEHEFQGAERPHSSTRTNPETRECNSSVVGGGSGSASSNPSSPSTHSNTPSTSRSSINKSKSHAEQKNGTRTPDQRDELSDGSRALTPPSPYAKRGKVFRVFEEKGFGFVQPVEFFENTTPKAKALTQTQWEDVPDSATALAAATGKTTTSNGGVLSRHFVRQNDSDNLYFNLSECVDRKVKKNDLIWYEEAPNARYGMKNIAVRIIGGTGQERKVRGKYGPKQDPRIYNSADKNADELSEAELKARALAEAESRLSFQLGRAALLADATAEKDKKGVGRRKR